MADEQQFHVGVKAMIQNEDGKILLMKEDVSTHSIPTDEYWDFPGGRVQEGESVIEALGREIEEETGIKKILEPTFKTAVVSNHQIKLKSGYLLGLVLMVYNVKIEPEAKIVLNDEHLDSEWVSIAEAKKRLTHKYPKEFTDAL